ncbi:hypothetical protein ACX80O_02350 [Arthrobacter sp. Hz1]
MASVDLGGAVKVTWPTTHAAGAIVALAVVQPDGKILSPVPAVSGNPAEASFIPLMPGRYLVKWTVGGSAPDAYTDVVDVWPEDPRQIISLDEARSSLNWPPNAPAKDVEDLRLYIAAATPVIEDIVGPVVAGTRTHVFSSAGPAVLPVVPSVILSVTVNGEPFTSYHADLSAGIVYAGSTYYPQIFPAGEVIITYSFGTPVIPPNIRLATRELIRHWWQIGKQATGGGRQEPSAEGFTPSGFAVPRRVIELCAPHELLGGFA